MAHENKSGNCAKCEELFGRYPGFNETVKAWFKSVQAKIPSFHISCAGRGRIEQNQFFLDHSSNARWTQSAHNWNAAIDTFFLIEGKYDLSEELYLKNIQPLLTPEIEWYGRPEYKKNPQKYYERPHFELAAWKTLRDETKIALVEPVSPGALKS